MKERNVKRKIFNKENRLYWYTALGSLAIVLSLVILVTSISLASEKANEEAVNPPANEDSNNDAPSLGVPDDKDQATTPPDEQPVVTTPEGFVMPVSSASVLHNFGFYYNQTLNTYYEHEGMDFSAEAGTQVFAVEDGTVESVYTSDVLSGTEIVVDHGDGVKTLYRFVTANDGLVAGASVKKGDLIATVAEANGSEYKDGAHLHFEVLKNGKNVDPVEYLTFEEK